jgi:hypothetical protein
MPCVPWAASRGSAEFEANYETSSETVKSIETKWFCKKFCSPKGFRADKKVEHERH